MTACRLFHPGLYLSQMQLLKRGGDDESPQKFYFFRFGFLGADFLADFDEAGGGVFNIRRRPSSKLNPLDLIATGFGMKPLKHKTPIMANKISIIREGLTFFDKSVILSWKNYYQTKNKMSDDIIPLKSEFAPGEYPVRYSKSHFHRVVHADGVYGGTTPTIDSLMMHIYSHMLPLPDYSVNDNKGDEVKEKRIIKPGVEREVEVSIVMSLTLAKSIRDWLNDRIKYVEELKQKTGAQ
jgi:hypothetical protein